ncbi:MAG TPA: YegS/Rv2252/BmrU family lipid kinase [Blastocatellia bacterium]|nr:YegS/Rv2252/BmrU family lipid kinase [Blastocatellia bacterium]
MANRRAAIIYNPMSGRPGRRTENALDMVRLLEEQGIEAGATATSGPSDATRLAREAVERGADTIISYGGDGTLNEVIQGMIGSQTSLAVWAGGTANVVARDLGLPFNKEELAKIIASGRSRRITLGLASRPGLTGNGASGPQEQGTSSGLQAAASSAGAFQRYFFMFSGIGLDASIARRVNLKLKRRTGQFAYWVTGLKHMLSWRAEPFDVEVDGKTYESIFTLVGNGKGYGGGLCMTPRAKLEEPWFEVFVMPRRSNNIVYLSDLAACLSGNAERTKATLVRGQHVKAASPHELWVQADGEIIGALPMTFDAVPDALSIIIP